MKKLTDILNFYGSDKGTKTTDRHNYGAVYGALFESRRNTPVKLLEFGIAQGSSICAWMDYFPRGEIYGVDWSLLHLSPTVPRDDPRLHLIEGEAADPKILPDVMFDIMIDDSNHVTDTQIKTLLAHWPRLSNGGLYIIEDLFVGTLPWGGEASRMSWSFLWPYSGQSRSPARPIFPRHPQDIFFLHQKNMPKEVAAILDANEHFFTISSVSTDGGLHMTLVIRRTDDS